jgi:hypothetical protein
MKRLLSIGALISVGLALVSNAQALEFAAYFENQFYPRELKDEVVLQDYNKLRLDLSAEASENVTFNGDYIYRIFHGATRLNTLDLIPDRVVSEYADSQGTTVGSLRPLFEMELEDENFLDNAYVTLYFEHVNIRIGKQQLPWGTGYTWNPTDIFNVKNALDPTYDKEGVNAFKVELPFAIEGMITAILGVDEDLGSSTKAFKGKHHVLGFDLSLSFVEKAQGGFDYILSKELSERRRLLGADFSGQLLGVGVWGEGAYNLMESSEDFGQYLLGADYTLENGLYFMGEYYKNGVGKTNKEHYDFNDWMRFLGDEGENLGRDYLFLGERYPIGELWTWANYMVINLNDPSGVFFPWFDYSLGNNTELSFVGYVPFGERETEFGEFGIGGFARIRVYF